MTGNTIYPIADAKIVDAWCAFEWKIFTRKINFLISQKFYVLIDQITGKEARKIKNLVTLLPIPGK
jgi:hypothetical protein